MFKSLLVANRGEIACRVTQTAQRLGLRVIAVYSDADEHARHVALADEAWPIGPAPAAESYLCADKILHVAKQAGAQAIHPGYGFLSENAAFAEACAAAGILFVGPPASAIRAMGLKDAAKTLMKSAGVPVVPGYEGENQDADFLAEQARAIGFPVLIKAVAGGGGKGMRRVDAVADFPKALSAAQREAKAAFGEDRVLIEKFVTQPRHIEVQVFADQTGNAVSLFERDCSVQRRHQKVIEEAPAPGMSAQMRAEMGAAAVAAAKAVDYEGAGTVEFIVDTSDGLRPDRFYFMEMNTRLQVEHPVTEYITGVDLVEWQLRVAAGQPLPDEANHLNIDGHAVEARLYAEDPAKSFFPSPGVLTHLRFPKTGPHIRIDTGVRQGDEVTLNYDPMIAKIIAWDETRALALSRLEKALGQVEIVGPKNNSAFLARLVAHDAFVGGDLDTAFIERYEADLLVENPPGDAVFAIAACAEVFRQNPKLQSGNRSSAWGVSDGWRLPGTPKANTRIELSCKGYTRVAELQFGNPGALSVGVDNTDFDIVAERVRGRFGKKFQIRQAATDEAFGDAKAILSQDTITVFWQRSQFVLKAHSPLDVAEGGEGEIGAIVAPLTGKIVSVHVSPGESVRRGQPLIVLEAMKMEHTLAAEADGIVESINFGGGDQVQDGQIIIAFAQEV